MLPFYRCRTKGVPKFDLHEVELGYALKLCLYVLTVSINYTAKQVIMHWHLPILFIFHNLFLKDNSMYKLLQQPVNLEIAILFLALSYDIHKFL